jgi:hypothetical protein
MTRLALALLALLALAAPAAAQTVVTTADRLAVGTTDGPTTSGAVVRIAGVPTAASGGSLLWLNAVNDVVTRALARTDLDTAIAYRDTAASWSAIQTFNAINVFAVNQTFSADIAVNGGDISATGALTIRPAAGNLTLDPSGDVILAADGLDFLPATNYTYNLGSITARFLTAHIAELEVETLVARDKIVTVGGSLVVAEATELIADVSTGATTIDVKHNQIASGDRVYLHGSGAIEWMAVTSGATVITGGYRYSVTRNLDGSGANAWVAGDAVVNTGTTGDGFIDLYATNGVLTGTGPTIVGNVRTGTTYNQVAPRWAIGELNGLYGYASTAYGFAAGDPSGANITADATNGLRLRTSTTNKIQVTAAGELIVGANNLTIDNTGIRITPATTYDQSRSYYFDSSSRFGAATEPGLYYSETSGAGTLEMLNCCAGTSQQVFVRADNGTGTAYFNGIGASTAAATSVTILAGFSSTQAAITMLGTGDISAAGTFFQFGTDLQVRFDNSSSNPGMPWMRSDGNYIVLNADGDAVYLAWDAGTSVQLGANTYVRGAVLPGTSNSYALGDPALRWGEIYFSEPTTGTALFPLVSNSGRIMAKNDGLNGTTTCAGAQRISSITVEFGIVISVTCS